jgi:NADH:ubiquinone reductase (H+-translocating)
VTKPPPSATRIVILGGGFAGVYVARNLLKQARQHPGHPIEVHLVNRENYMVFQPMLPEVISGSVGIADTVSPIRRIAPGALLHTREIEHVDLENHQVICSPGFRPRSLVLPYDHLVVALGNVTDFRGMTGLADHAMPFKSLGDALALRNHVIRILEEADGEADPELRGQLLTFVVGGGGFSGVEVIAELHDFIRRAIRNYPRLGIGQCRFILLHSRERILPEVHEALALYAQRLLTRRGIEIMFNTRLSAATGDHAILGDGTRLATKTLVATVPSHPNPVVEQIIKSLGITEPGRDGKPRPAGKLPVDGTLKVQGTANVWALGDCAVVPLPTTQGEQPAVAPPTAQHAIREATVCARNIAAAVAGKPMHGFDFTGLGSLAALGHRKGVAQIMGIKFSGFFAWVMWRAIYLGKLPGLDRKIKVGISWLLDLFFPPDLVQLRIGKTTGMVHQHYEPGQCVFEQGDLGDRVYIIGSGKAQVVRCEDGQEIPLAVLGAGEYFGEMALLHRAPRSATVRCVEAMDVLAIEKGDFDTLVTHLDELRNGFMQTAEHRKQHAAASR